MVIIAADAVHPELGKLQVQNPPQPPSPPKPLNPRKRMWAHREAIRRAQREVLMFQ
ncbi:MAG: hypothetical protein HY975_02750 [Candidatus Kerfeldbacteria bacterium]|nr:hypothetical protein [Candidatus Kerfeldbacteria bacterium]